MCCHFLHQGIFLPQGSNLRLLHYRGRFYTTEPSGKPQLNLRYILNVFSNVHQREMEIMETRKERLRNVKSRIIWCNKHLSILESENLGNAAGHYSLIQKAEQIPKRTNLKKCTQRVIMIKICRISEARIKS